MRQVLSVSVAVLLVGCATAPSPIPTGPPRSVSAPPGGTARPAPTPDSTPGPFRTVAFAAIPEEPVAADLAAKLQAALQGMAGEAGVSATLMSAAGRWSGATGTADGVRDVTTDTQFSIASTTKAVTAAQVMQLVEGGKLDLDDLASDHLPAKLRFDTNGATIRSLLGHRSGIPDYADVVGPQLEADPRRFWTPAELLAAIPSERHPAGRESEYANVNYLLLGLVIEKVTGRPISKVMHDGVLDIDGVDRLIYQPDEKPTPPIAFDNGRSQEWFESVGGFLPSLAYTSDAAAAAMASDSVSLARWWQALCSGQLVSKASLTQMLPTDDWYGLGLGRFAETIGHFGSDGGGVSLAGCVPEDGIVVAVLANRNGYGIDAGSAAPLIQAMREGAAVVRP
jgi:D-alanyl-D-alanine carboxypeptidase